jgi:hypothetical protein
MLKIISRIDMKEKKKHKKELNKNQRLMQNEANKINKTLILNNQSICCYLLKKYLKNN